MAVDFAFNPELRLLNGSIIRNRDDALGFLRAQETRPGVDDRDEILHLMERAEQPAAAEAAAVRFRDWLRELEVLDERP
jgi:hypothetical protein